MGAEAIRPGWQPGFSWVHARAAEASPKKIKHYVDGAWKESKTGKVTPCYHPSIGAVIAYAPQCTAGSSIRTTWLIHRK